MCLWIITSSSTNRLELWPFASDFFLKYPQKKDRLAFISGPYERVRLVVGSDPYYTLLAQSCKVIVKFKSLFTSVIALSAGAGMVSIEYDENPL